MQSGGVIVGKRGRVCRGCQPVVWFFGDLKIFHSRGHVVGVVTGTIGCPDDVTIWMCRPYMSGLCVVGQGWWQIADILVVVGEGTVGLYLEAWQGGGPKRCRWWDRPGHVLHAVGKRLVRLFVTSKHLHRIVQPQLSADLTKNTKK